MLDDTVAGLVDATGLGAAYPIWVIPSRVYPEMYSRDSFWTLAAMAMRAPETYYNIPPRR